MQITKAMARAMTTMLRGPVYVQGGFGGSEAYGQVASRFAKRITIDCLIREGYAEPGEAFNSYCITAKGKERYSSWAKRSVARGKRSGRHLSDVQVVR